ncbi:MAG: hypothetical protein HOL74_01580 [Flavobacteriales bacterium]|nr:hypothetical protein [Flavobacteriales bacterium]
MKLFLSLISLSILVVSCGVYSFTGASIPTEAKTISVQYISNKAAIVQPSLSQVITDGLIDAFAGQTNLEITENEGDLSFSGYITKYQIKPMAIKANETASQNRLTIAIKIKYNNSFDDKQNFESTFSRYRDYASSENIVDVEDGLIKEISKELIEDVFNKAFVNW